MKCFYVILVVCSGITYGYGQNSSWKLRDRVNHARMLQMQEPIRGQFQLLPTRDVAGNPEYQVTTPGLCEALLSNSDPIIQIDIPTIEGALFSCDLIPIDLGPCVFKENNSIERFDITKPKCYQGIIQGMEDRHTVVMTVYPDHLRLTFHLANNTWSVTSTEKNNRNQGKYIFHNHAKDPPLPENFCGTTEPQGLTLAGIDVMPRQAPEDKCVYVFVECFDSLWQWQNSDYALTIQYVMELFNNINAGFANELINIKISTINVWTIMDPYNQPSREVALADLAAAYQDNYWGNICVGLDYGTIPRSGLAGAIGRVKGEYPNICPMYTPSDHTFCYNDLNYNYGVQDFPAGPLTTQSQLYLVMHEIGHLLGSAHTHWCGWSLGNGNFGALDGCAPVEGSCSPGPIPPPGGGTIMSYCGGVGDPGISFNNGFGTLPGAVVRYFVDSNSCLSDCPECPNTLVLDYDDILMFQEVYHHEVSDSITVTGTLTLDAHAVLDGGNSVILTNGFHAALGSRLRVVNEGCGGIW